MTVDARKFPRLKVHLRVAYKRGDKFVEKYADNISAGGLFVKAAEGLAQKDVIALEIDLPKHGLFKVNAEVMHVSDAGAGLQLKSPPGVFATALAAYLARLEQRTDSKVFVDEDPWRRMCSDAGYRVLPLPGPHAMIGVISDEQAIGVLAPVDLVEAYKSALGFLGADDAMVIVVDPKRPAEPVLALLDDRLGNRAMSPVES
ncbi:MAG: PilZ domain-containing protein [Myxococcota bacterium]|nr:PilZ domain-containing protein [Deltaproteobacteria bacterium]MDQ3339033.1 PilZ domain-containing protein [Myxococcota bacterium]